MDNLPTLSGTRPRHVTFGPDRLIVMFSRPQHRVAPASDAVNVLSLSDIVKGLCYLEDDSASLRAYSSLDTRGKLRTGQTGREVFDMGSVAQLQQPLPNVRKC
jgi:hypothetical protein